MSLGLERLSKQRKKAWMRLPHPKINSILKDQLLIPPMPKLNIFQRSENRLKWRRKQLLTLYRNSRPKASSLAATHRQTKRPKIGDSVLNRTKKKVKFRKQTLYLLKMVLVITHRTRKAITIIQLKT